MSSSWYDLNTAGTTLKSESDLKTKNQSTSNFFINLVDSRSNMNSNPVDSFFKPIKSCLELTVLQGKDLQAMDPSGRADPYCVIKFGTIEHTTEIQYRTLNPVWNQTFSFEVDNIPQSAFAFPLSTVNSNGSLQLSQVPLCELLYYIYIDLWDKDTLNRDDYIGRVILPISTIPYGTIKRWYPIGRTPASPSASGKIELSLTLKALDETQTSTRWCIDELLMRDGEKLSNFQLPLLSGNQTVLYPGNFEHVELVIDDVLVEISGHRGLGRIYLTDFRLVVLCTSSSSTNLAKTSDLSLWIPLNLIISVERGDELKVIRKTEAGSAGISDVKTLIIKCEDFRTVRFTFLKSKPNVHTYLETKLHTMDEVKQLEDDIESLNLVDRTTSLTCKSDFTNVFRKLSVSKKEELMLSDNKLKSNQPDFQLDGWNFYKPEAEFKRQGISELWKLSKLNGDYSVSSSYPCHLYVPSVVKEEDIIESATFRSKGRVPVLTWFNNQRKTFMMRCSQPKFGAMGKFNVADENIVQAAKNASPVKRLVIFDARSMLAAGGNRLKGKGTEDIVNRYHGLKLLFLDIANIHAMRESIDKLQVVCESAQDSKWMSQLESTQWMLHIRSVLKGATLIAHYLSEKNVSVLLHCSDGWDRTPQLSALAQVLLDSYYRTFDGFKVLVMKDWISFGHRFSDRLGDPLAPTQRSPIFLQFLDCVCQVVCQFPEAFQFTMKYLVRIAEHINSGWFGDFLCNSIREREHENIMRTTVSIWAHLDAAKEEFTNKLYQKSEEVLFPVCSLRRLHFWQEYYLRFDDVAFSLGLNTWDDIDGSKDFDDSLIPTNTVVWVPDERVCECHDCKQKFTGIRRKHHCRACGQVFCGSCTRHRIKLPFLGYNLPERVCDGCWLNTSKSGKEEEVEDYEIITSDTKYQCV